MKYRKFGSTGIDISTIVMKYTTIYQKIKQLHLKRKITIQLS
jgi:hypothetical protein